MGYDEELADRIRAALSGDVGVSERAMFGGLGFSINGNLAVSASGQGGLLLRVDPAEAHALLLDAHAEPFVMRGRELSGWLRIDPAGVDTDTELGRWVEIGVAYARTLPPK